MLRFLKWLFSPDTKPDTSNAESHELLAQEILQFLNEVGPKPKANITNGMTDDEILDDEELSRWLDRIHYTYQGRFLVRVARALGPQWEYGHTRCPICGHGGSILDPPVATEQTMRDIAARLLDPLMGSKPANGSIRPPKR